MSIYRRTLPLQSATLRYAEDAIGLGETSANWGPFVSRCLRFAEIEQSAPWCAAFVNAMAEIAAMFRNQESPLEQVSQQALVQSYVEWATQNGRLLTSPQAIGVGDLVCFHTGRTSRPYDHMGFVRASDDDTPDGKFRTVEANTAPDVTAGSARDRDGEIVAAKLRSFSEMEPVFIAWGREL